MDFKAGDKVKVVKKGNDFNWTRSMDKTIGRNGIVLSASSVSELRDIRTIKVEFNGYETWWYKQDELELVKKEFTKNDLKTGYLVILRDGTIYTVLLNTDYKASDNESVLVRSKQWSTLGNYNEDLTNKMFKNLDIVKVIKPWHPYKSIDYDYSYNSEDNEVLFERKEKTEKEIQIEELEKQVEALLNKIKELKGE